MRNIKEITDAIMTIVIIKKEDDEGVQKLLKEWSSEIVDECSDILYNKVSHNPKTYQSVLKVKDEL